MQRQGRRAPDAGQTTAVEDCAHGGWQTYGFASQQKCEAYVTSGGGSGP